MATRGYNGTIVVLVNHGEYSALSQAGNSYDLYTGKELEVGLDSLLDLARESDDYVQWYDKFFKEDSA